MSPRSMTLLQSMLDLQIPNRCLAVLNMKSIQRPKYQARKRKRSSGLRMFANMKIGMKATIKRISTNCGIPIQPASLGLELFFALSQSCRSTGTGFSSVEPSSSGRVTPLRKLPSGFVTCGNGATVGNVPLLANAVKPCVPSCTVV